jgi:hypothetical protein
MLRDPDRRWHRRQPAAYSARVVLTGHPLAQECFIEDMSSGGARIRFATAVALPPEFVLEVSSLFLRVDAHVVWSQGEHHGVRLVWSQHRHYGAIPGYT